MPATNTAAGTTGRARRPLARLLRRHDRGAAIIEFALVALPFFFLLFGIIELGLIFAANVNLSNSMLNIARRVRVGNLILPGMAVNSSSGAMMDLADFKKAVCGTVVLMPSATCQAQLQLDVRVLSSFATPPANPVVGNSFSTSSFCFYSGRPGNIVSMRAYLLWPVATPVLLSSLAQVKQIVTPSGTAAGNFFVLAADEAFVNEPNNNAANTGNGC